MERNYSYKQRIERERLEIRRKQIARRKIHTLVTSFSLLLLLTTIISANVIIANAGQGYEKNYQKLYTSVVVEAGETVWEIAVENMAVGYDSINELVEEIGFINGLDDAYSIKEGSTLIIPYYDEL